MFVDPKTGEVIPTHPMEMPRIQGYRDYGFDGLDIVHNWVVARLDEHNQMPFSAIYKSANKYISIVVESPVSAAVPHYLVNLEVGYIDFMDQSLQKMAGLQYALYKQSRQITLISASDDLNAHAINIDDVIAEVSSTSYLSIPTKATA